MAASAPESLAQIPGFRDRLGERVIIPQPSGALLEYLHFCDALATAPFFEAALKERISRLGNFSHSSYCRIRRVQHVAERDGRPALVSAHVAGRRLAEILDVSARAELRPSTAGLLAVTRQLMASAALLHDFAPYGFHGALGPDRIILAGDGRIVVAEHVLGGVIEQGAAAWGPDRMWREFRVAALPEPTSTQYGRRLDIVQIGLVTLAMLLGRPLGSTEFPAELPALLNEATETTQDGSHVPLRSGLRGWLERALVLRGDASFRTLLEAQKAFSQILQDDGYGASSVAWESFVNVCETAAVRVPVVVVVPESPRVEVVSNDAGTSSTPVVPLVEAPLVASPAGLIIEATPAAGDGSDSGVLGAEGMVADAPARDADANAARLREDPFGPWPVADPAKSAATLLETFDTPPAQPTSAAVLSALPAPDPATEPDPWATLVDTPSGTGRPDARPETLFETPAPTPVPVSPPAAPPTLQSELAVALSWEEPPASKGTSPGEWRPAPRRDAAAAYLYGEDEQPEAESFEETTEPEPPERIDKTRLIVLIVLTLVATACALFAPYVWKVVYEGRMAQGTLVVTSNPDGAVISVDGQVRGHTPAELAVKEGDHLLELQVGGSATSKRVHVAGNRKTTEAMTFPEAGERGGLMISTYPAIGRITIDGVPRGQAPLRVADLQPGAHTLLVETALGSQEQDVIVQAGRVAQLAVPTASWVKVNAPYELTVQEDGKVLGTIANSPVMVRPGRHTLEFVNKALGLRIRQYVDVAPGQVAVVPLDLPMGVLNLFADLAADVFVDGQRAGQTPVAGFAVPLGSHDVVFRHPKHGEVRYTVQVTLAAPAQVTVTFSK